MREEQPADRRRASEAQLSQPRVGKQRLADGGRARACHQVDHPAWQASLLQYIDQEHCGQWGEVGRLEDDRASGGEGGRDLAGRHGEREVPGGDEIAGTHRLARNVQGAGAFREDAPAAADADRLLGEPAEELGSIAHLCLGFGQGLAHLSGDRGGDFVAPVPQPVIGVPKDVRPVPRRR